MSHTSATITLSKRISEAAPARPLLLVERLDHTSGSHALFSLCATPPPAAPTAAAFTLCAGPPPAYLTSTTAMAVEGDTFAGAWI
uniref:Uncharacterized protein n=1 Tax=Streptomyces sp. NBC_00008 TaxID=2903610 RepID=A0AAU2W3Q8_9ACTN